MQLKQFSVRGFRSLAEVDDIPVGSPTILTGHNDSGKSAALAALAFLLGEYSLCDEDRTFQVDGKPSTGLETIDIDQAGQITKPKRVECTWVEGLFTLSDAEQEAFGLPSELRIRRRSPLGGTTSLEMFCVVPENPDLRNIAERTLADLKKIAKQLGVSVPSQALKADWVNKLTEFADTQPKVHEWIPVPTSIAKRLPTLLSFHGGAAPDPEGAVKAVLNRRYQELLQEPGIKGTVSELENLLQSRLRDEAEELRAHIQQRCHDLRYVNIEPDVSFTHGLRRASLRLARSEGEEVGLDGAGTGRARRVSLAVWEWTSKLTKAASRSTGSAGAEGSTSAETTGSENAVASEVLDIVIAYDEPDTHLDYGYQRRIMDLIREQCAQEHVRMIVATHSLNLIDGVDISDVVHMRLKNDRTTIERLDPEKGHDDIDKHLRDIAAALGVRNSVMLHERCFVGVEGATEQQAFPVLFRLVTGFPLQSMGIALWGCNNNEGALQFVKFLLAHNRTVALIIDADSFTQRRDVFHEDKLRAAGLDLTSQVYKLGNPNEVEELFTDEQWAAAANQLWGRNDGQPWKPEQFTECRKGKFSRNVWNLVCENSDKGPAGKPAMLYELACTLTSAEEVPKELRDVFNRLVDLANSEPDQRGS
ncbi:ATP-dependent nuclease [Carbonactinospora thermoautotrophica]|uniref:ATP-dependent nuclease n=1 Tax=Carbonactinospora thermoautotrophica TaxID=1469144 RepID=UPI002270C4DC|nr:AAA family ATPase [Carbonactinospora thermoautotrophica]